MNDALDACSMIGYLQGGPGGNVVASVLTDPSATCYAHMMNLIEVYDDLIHRSNEASARAALSLFFRGTVSLSAGI